MYEPEGRVHRDFLRPLYRPVSAVANMLQCSRGWGLAVASVAFRPHPRSWKSITHEDPPPESWRLKGSSKPHAVHFHYVCP